MALIGLTTWKGKMKDLINLVKHTLEKNVTVNGEGSRNNYTKLTFSDGTVVELSVEENGFGIRINFDKWVVIPSNYDRGRLLAVLQGKEYTIVDEEDSILSQKMRDIEGTVSNIHVDKLLRLLAQAKKLGIEVRYNDGTCGYYGITTYPSILIFIDSTLGKTISDVETAVKKRKEEIECDIKNKSSLFMRLKLAEEEG